MKSIFFFISILFVSLISFGQDQISGTVYDKNTGETMIGVSIIDTSTMKGTITNNYGRFFLKVAGEDSVINLAVSCLGYTPITILVEKSDVINLFLEPKLFEIDEIVVTPKGINMQTPNRRFTILPIDLKQMPSFSGEADLITLMQLIPGVSITGDGNATLNVRGGSNDQNLYLIDDMPLYYMNHLGGFLSTFNSDIIKSTDFYKSGFSSYYGGRLSSIVDVRTNDGNLHEYNVYGTIGLLSSKIGIEGPVVKDKSSFLISARKNTIPIFRWLWNMDIDYRFYDTNIKYNYILSSKDRVFFSFYKGKDLVELRNNEKGNRNKQAVAWGNIAGSIRYGRLFSSKLYGNLIVGHTSYLYSELTDSKIITNDGETNKYFNEFLSNIRDNFLKINFEHYPREKIKLIYGYEYINHNHYPGKSTTIQSGPDYSDLNIERGFPESRVGEHDVYVQSKIDDFYRFSINAGIRTAILFSGESSYILPEPRISISKTLGNVHLTASYDAMHQCFHTLTNQGAGIPVEYRIPVLTNAPPEKSEMVSTAISYIPKTKSFQIDIDFYTKRLNNLVTLKDGISFTAYKNNLEDIFYSEGKGQAKGIELTIRKTGGKTTGWIGSTIAKSERVFEEINNGNPFNYKYDRPFEFKIYVAHQQNMKLSFSASWVYGSGTPISIPVGQYYDLENEVVLIYGERNSIRGKPYHRLDVGINYKLSPKWGESVWSLSIINLYNRKNPYYYYADYDNGFNGTGKMTFYERNLFPFLPSISYGFKFK